MDAAAGAVRFLIIAAPRTGSTHLRLLLNSHPLVCCHGEVFRDEFGSLTGLSGRVASPLKDRLTAARDRNPPGFLMDEVLFPGSFRAVGAKFVYATFGEPRWHGLWERIVAERGLRIVHLVRRNRLKRFVSQFVVERVTGKALVLGDEPVPAVKPVSIPVNEFLADAAATEAEERRVRDALAGHPVHEVAYEDLVGAAGSRARGAIQEFLGVPPGPLASQARQILPHRIDDTVANIGAIRQHLAGTPWAWMAAAEPVE